MINIKPKICDALKKIDNVNVSSEYPNDWSKFPIITYTEEDNSTYMRVDGKENMCRIIYRFDIWHNRSTSDIAIKLDEVISSLGLERKFCKDISDSSGLKHKIFRYEGIVDVNTLRVYQR